MQDWRTFFAGKRITVFGLGLLGRGVGDVEFLATYAGQVLVTDRKTEEQLKESVERLRPHKNVSFRLGEQSEEDFRTCDMVIKAAGVPLDSPYIKVAHDASVSVFMSTALFAKCAQEIGATIVGVTGTRGKSTVTHMIHHSLIRANKRTVLGGNVRGLSTLAMLPEVKKGDIAVLELDSWQLQGFGDLEMSPNISVFTNLMPDHQNYYKNMDEYFADKANIFKYQKSGDTLFVGKEIESKVSVARPTVAPQVPATIPADWKLQIVGEHNRENASFAVSVLRALGLSDAEIKLGLESFEGVEGRLQFLREINGVKIYNDNNATTPDATIIALKALGKNITLIVGGSDKGLPLEELVSEIKERVSRVILLIHSNYEGSKRLADILTKSSVSYEEANDIRYAIRVALQTKSGTILFSPAFASFGMFQNEYDRNDQFIKLVQAL